MTTLSTQIVWRAARDGIGHGHRPGWPRTLCGLVVITESLAWPERLRCVDCINLSLRSEE